ncbi:MAG: acyl-[acyl-carrier-protein]--UDP-N-acetylglucosamine O-acyltransferase [Desulfobulbaceae bacterium A2]|nr:MAG: acyl-[acyl-carrier-protein]--UDP-N-acetylglucosamine O-acyltransferase [Desulfobulbaceae bacterium A2]
MPIHPTAVVDPRAELADNVIVGPYAVIEGQVRIGADCEIGAHAVVSGPTTIGSRNIIGSFASVGAPPQDIHYRGEPTELIIGDDNQIREYASIHRGTVSGRGRTVLGNRNMLMAYTHVAHDCILGDNIIMANVATLGGHVEVGDNAGLGGLVAIHQYCRVGKFTHIGGLSGINMDVPPFVLLSGTRNQMRISGLNKVGLRRSGMRRETYSQLEQAYRIIFRTSELLLVDALARTLDEIPDCPEVQHLVEFFRNSGKRGVVRRTEDD